MNSIPWVEERSKAFVPLDDFDVILGVDFLIPAKVSVMPHLGGILICDEKSPAFVSGVFIDQSSRLRN